MRITKRQLKRLLETFINEDDARPGTLGLSPDRNPFADKSFLEDEPLVTQVRGGSSKTQKRADSGDQKSLSEIEIESIKDKGVNPVVGTDTASALVIIPKFTIGNETYTVSNGTPQRYFNMTKMRFVTDDEMNKKVTIEDLGKKIRVNFFHAASGLEEKAFYDWGVRTGKNVTVPKKQSLLNIMDPLEFYRGSKHIPTEETLRKNAATLTEIEKSALSKVKKSFILENDLNVFITNLGSYQRLYKNTVEMEILTVEYIEAGTVEVESGKITGLSLKRVNIINDEEVETINLELTDLTQLIDTIDNRLKGLNLL